MFALQQALQHAAPLACMDTFCRYNPVKLLLLLKHWSKLILLPSPISQQMQYFCKEQTMLSTLWVCHALRTGRCMEPACCWYCTRCRCVACLSHRPPRAQKRIEGCCIWELHRSKPVQHKQPTVSFGVQLPWQWSSHTFWWRIILQCRLITIWNHP